MTSSRNRREAWGRVRPYVLTVMFIVGLTILFKVSPFSVGIVNIALSYLLPVLLSATRWGKGPSFFAAGLGVIVFDVLFVPPLYSITVSDLRYLISFFILLLVAFLMTNLATRLKRELNKSNEAAASTAALYALGQEFSRTLDISVLEAQVAHHIQEALGMPSVIYRLQDDGDLSLGDTQTGPASANEALGSDTLTDPPATRGWGASENEWTIARWVLRNRKPAGFGTDWLPGMKSLFVPLITENELHGVLAVNCEEQGQLTAQQSEFLMALSGLTALTMARVQAMEEAKRAQIAVEAEQLRNTLLNSISHELRTPLATIMGSVTALMEGETLFTDEERRELLGSIFEGSTRMNHLVNNLLEMVRIESGMMKLNLKWCDIEDILGVVLRLLKDSLNGFDVRICVHPDVPPLFVDDMLVEQTLMNVIGNAAKYSRDKKEIDVAVKRHDSMVVVSVTDFGIGIREADGDKVFEKFYRAKNAAHVPGTGLGLAICRSIMDAHDGFIRIAHSSPRGTTVELGLPVPKLDEEDAGWPKQGHAL